MSKEKIPEKIKETIKKYIKVLEEDGLPVERVFLYGSYARGKVRRDSDIDVIVISPKFGKDRIKEGQYLFKKAWRVDSRIEPIPCHPRNYKKNNISPLLSEVRKSAIEI